jgi:hypothetical protein
LCCQRAGLGTLTSQRVSELLNEARIGDLNFHQPNSTAEWPQGGTAALTLTQRETEGNPQEDQERFTLLAVVECDLILAELASAGSAGIGRDEEDRPPFARQPRIRHETIT